MKSIHSSPETQLKYISFSDTIPWGFYLCLIVFTFTPQTTRVYLKAVMDAVLFDSIVSQLLSKKQDQTIEAWWIYILWGRWIHGEIMLTCRSFAHASISMLPIAASFIVL